MTEKERFQRAFAPLHASPDTMTEVTKMTERKTKRPALRRAATIGLAAALVLALGSVAFEPDGTERALTEEELLADINCPEVTYRDDGTVTVYYLDQKLDVTDKFDEDGVCYVQLEGGEKTIYMTIKRGNGYATSTTKYILPNEFNN